jgi:hypothetical protein
MRTNLSLSSSFTRGCWAILLSVVVFHQPIAAQDRTFSLTGSAGYGLLSLGAVDAKNASDVAGWTNLGFPLGSIASVKQSPFLSARMTYRYTRDFAISLYGSYFSKAVSSSYEGSDAVLKIDRSVGATDLCLGIAYYPAAQPFLLEWYLQVNLGVILARGTTRTIGSQAVKSGAVTTMVPFDDSEGIYRKTKTSASFFVGANIPLLRSLFLKGEAGYRLAQVGELDGSVTSFGVQSSMTSTTMFDFSGLLVSVGVGIEF